MRVRNLFNFEKWLIYNLFKKYTDDESGKINYYMLSDDTGISVSALQRTYYRGTIKKCNIIPMLRALGIEIELVSIDLHYIDEEVL